MPFDVRIPAEAQNPHLADELVSERPGILAWMVEAALNWQAERLGEPPAVTEAVTAYQAEMDVIGAFLEENSVKALTRPSRPGNCIGRM